MAESLREKELRIAAEELFDSHAPRADIERAAELYRQEYLKRRADWTGFSECGAVRLRDGRTCVVTVLGFEYCGLIEVDLERRLLLGSVDANTPDQLTPLQVAPALAKELKVLVKKVWGPSGTAKPMAQLFEKHLPSWSRSEVA